ncbi:DMT family transporter [Roseibium sp.]|uniref:DMT family transporter n=1 Tax=Roseibium sp. TaxID=1936156 RepID=UPI003A981FBB
MDLQDNKRAIIAMLVANGAFIINDALVKLVSGSLPLGQIIFLRGLVTIFLIGGVCAATGVFRSFRVLASPKVVIRTLAEVVATLLYLNALTRIPIANATAILQALPLVVTAAAAIFLGAHVGWRRWSAVGVGLIGVLLIVRPGFEGFDAWALLALAGVFSMALRDLVTRQMPREIPTFGVSLATAIGVTVLGGGLMTTQGWEPVGLQELGILFAAAGFVLCGYIFIILAMRSGDISVVAPFRYSAVLWALGLGYAFWGEIPDLMTMAGTSIVVATGIYTFVREHRQGSLRRSAG